jgi:WhiB family redox-sensing transcriptional regulator
MTHPYDLPDAACRTADPDLFHPFGTGDLAKRQTRDAKRICGTCPGETACLKWAVDTGQREGIWGGRTAGERKKYGTGPLPAKAPEQQDYIAPVARPSRRKVMTSCPQHGSTGIRRRSRNGGTYCQPCNTAKVRAWRKTKAEQVPA